MSGKKRGGSATAVGYKEPVTWSSVPGAKNIPFSGPGTHRDHTQLSQEQPKHTHCLGSVLSKSPHWNSLNLFGHTTVKPTGMDVQTPAPSSSERSIQHSFVQPWLRAHWFHRWTPRRAAKLLYLWKHIEKAPVHVRNATSLYHLKITCNIKKRLITNTRIKQV